ncbi:hypothetical protein HN51_055583 [Arachis hypogaea]
MAMKTGLEAATFRLRRGKATILPHPSGGDDFAMRPICVPINMYFASLRYTSPTFVASIVNVIASLTFIIAVVLRLAN